MPLALEAPRSEEFRALLEERLPKKTYNHALSVTELLIACHEDVGGVSREQAEYAGLLHDLCKAMKGDALLEAAHHYGIDITDHQRERPQLLHGPVAAEEARQDLGMDDSDVYEAVFWHTTGKSGWCPTGVALYFADYSEPLRPHPQAAKARAILDREGFRPALQYVVDAKLGHVREKYGPDPAMDAFATWVRQYWS